MPQKLEDLLLSQQLLKQPPPTTPAVDGSMFALPDDPVSRALATFLGLKEQAPGDAASAIGATASLLPFGRLFGVLRKALPALKTEQQAAGAAKAILPEIAALDSRLSGLPPSPLKAPLKPDTKDKIYDLVMERQAMRRAGQEPIRVPTNPLADGTLPKHREVVPPYRSKAGIAVDTLEDLQSSGLLRGFAARHAGAKGIPPGFGSMHGYEGPTGLDVPRDVAFNLNRQDPHMGPQLVEDPVRYVGYMKSIDDTAFGQGRAEKRAAEELLGRSVPQPTMIDDLVQQLADFFAHPKFDPFQTTRTTPRLMTAKEEAILKRLSGKGK